jgi:uncharacterized Zn finger protein
MFDRNFFAGALTKARLEEWAGERYFARGAAYFGNGAVVQLRCDDLGIWARVLGTQPYVVRFWRKGKKPGWGCTCPLGIDGEFCKHLVATGLAFLSGKPVDGGPDEIANLEPIREFLQAATREELLELIMERAAWDEDLTAELLLAGRARPQKKAHRPKRARDSSHD